MKRKPLARVLAIFMSATMLASGFAVGASAGILSDCNNYVASAMNLTNNGLDVASSGLDTAAGVVNVATNAVNLDNSVKKRLITKQELKVSNIKLAGATISNSLDTATSAVKLGTDGANNVSAITDLLTSQSNLLFHTVNGLKEGTANTLGTATSGLKLADTVADVANPLPKINAGLGLFNTGYKSVKNLKEIKANHDNKNAANEETPISVASEVYVAENTNA